MKKNKIVIVVNWLLLFSLPIVLMTSNIKTEEFGLDKQTKNLATNLFSKIDVKPAETTQVEEQQENTEEEEEKNTDNQASVANKKVEVAQTVPQQTQKPQVEETIKEEKPSDVLATYTGSMSFYYANCAGCSGITSTGVSVSDGRIKYDDKEYGSVRIIAAGPEISKWSIVRIKNSELGSNVLAIVLDRGGAIGLGRSHLIDMLTNKEEGKGSVNKNITVEVLRDGR